MAVLNHLFRRHPCPILPSPPQLPIRVRHSLPISVPALSRARPLTCISSAHVNKKTPTLTTLLYTSIATNRIQTRARLSLVVDTKFTISYRFESQPQPRSQHHLCYSTLSEEMGKKNEEECSTKLLTLPTILTIARVVAIPVFIATFYMNSWWGTTATTSIFVTAAITDWLDGYLARKMRQGTAFGAFLDPVADKLMVAATLVLLCSRPPETSLLGDVPWLFPVPATAIIGREITMSAVREWAASQDTKLLQAVAVNNLGKWKTATQMTALTMLLASRDSSLAGSGTLVTSGVALLYISSGLAVWSLAVYMRKIWKVLLR